jgi:hypothetical protein
VVRDPAEAEERKSAWESGKWLEAKQQRLKKGTGYKEHGPKNDWGELPYNEQLAQYSPTRTSAATDPNAPFLPEEDVVPALLAGLESEERATVVSAAENRKSWPEWPAPRFAYNPPPRTEVNRVGASLEEKTERLQRKARAERSLNRRMNKWNSQYIAEEMIFKATHELDLQVEERSKHNPRGASHGEPAQRSRRQKITPMDKRGRSHSPSGKFLRPHDDEKQKMRQDFKKEAKKREQWRSHARDDKFDV